MDSIKRSKLAIMVPLGGLIVGWSLFMGAIYSDLFIDIASYDNQGNYIGPEPQVQLSTYLFLLGITAFGLAALTGQTMALRARTENDNSLAKAAHRFGNLLVIISLVAGAVFAIGNFLGAFNNYAGRDAAMLVRIFGVYVPILLATAVVVTILLKAFVFRKDAPDLANLAQDEDRKALQRAVGLAYAAPIIGTAIAIIFGLVVYDVTKTDLDVWIWVIIQLIIATAILVGTKFASKAKSAKPIPAKPRVIGIAAVNLNLVLSIVFGAVVSVMSFSFGAQAIDSLRVWGEWDEKKVPQQSYEIVMPDLEWLASDFLPALALLALAVIGIYKSIVVRHQSEINS